MISDASAGKSAQNRSTMRERPFDLDDDDSYKRWRDAKLRAYPTRAEDLIVEIADLACPNEAEMEAVRRCCRRANLAIHAITQSDADVGAIRRKVKAFAAAFGLAHLESHRSAGGDGIVSLEVAREGPRKGYIPYTTRPLNWHTDGYYNQAEARIRAFMLHCVRDASSGGENGFLDPELAYIRLRDKSRELVTALMQPDAMIIPSNVEKNGAVRPVSIGPVFSFHPVSGALHMRYSARARNIKWRDDSDTREAADALIAMLTDGEDVIRYRLAPGQGILCNNVLHNRSGFENGPGAAHQRLYLRSRYQDRISGT